MSRAGCRLLGRRPASVVVAGAVVALVFAAGCSATVDGHAVSASRCAPVFFGVPGSGQGALNTAPTTIPPGLSSVDVARYGTTVARLETELRAIAGSGLAAAASIDYPAIPVTQYVGAGGLTGDLDASEQIGVTKLVAAVHRSNAAGCTGRPVLISGYSQGAEVVDQAVTRLSPDERRGVTVALFGNPSYLPGARGDYPGGTDAAGIRPTFHNGTAYTLPDDVQARAIDVCAPGDPVCGVDPDVTSAPGRIAWVLAHVHVHTQSYADANLPYARTAARFLWEHRTG